MKKQFLLALLITFAVATGFGQSDKNSSENNDNNKSMDGSSVTSKKGNHHTKGTYSNRNRNASHDKNSMSSKTDNGLNDPGTSSNANVRSNGTNGIDRTTGDRKTTSGKKWNKKWNKQKSKKHVNRSTETKSTESGNGDEDSNTPK